MFQKFRYITALYTIIILTGCYNIRDEQNGFLPAPGDKIVPKDYRIKEPVYISKETPDFSVHMYSQGFKQGDAVYIECLDYRGDIERITVRFLDLTYPITKKNWGFRGIFPINPEEKPGKKKITFNYESALKSEEFSSSLNINKTKFKVVYKEMYLGKYSHQEYLEKKENKKFIKECTRLKKEAFSRVTPDYLSATLSHPRDMHYITSEYWYKRVYKKYYSRGKKRLKKKSTKTHRGLDLRGDKGAPVYAMERGIVALAKKLFFEGNMIIIDHGNRVFSYYMHLNNMNVEKGDAVISGEQIGEVGKTGRVTGPHLHVSFVINGIQVDPMSLFSLPMRR